MKHPFPLSQSLTWSLMLGQHLRYRLKLTTIQFLCTVFLYSCSWIPQVETVLHDAPEGYVSLRTVDDETFRTSQPAEISDTTITRILQGIQEQEQEGLLQTLITGNPQPTPIFSPPQVTYLTPLIRKAFEQATHEEEIYFRVANSVRAREHVEGLIFIYGSNMVFSIKSKTTRGSLNTTPSTKNYNSWLPLSSERITFSPQDAISTDDLSHIPYIQKMRRHSVLISYKKIDRHPSKPNDAPAKGMNVPVEPPVLKNAITPASIESSTSPEQTTEISTQLSTPIQQLHEQMEILKKQLREQKTEIERLKKLQR